MAALRFKPILSAGMRVQAVFKQNFIARWRETTIRYLVVLGFSLVCGGHFNRLKKLKKSPQNLYFYALL